MTSAQDRAFAGTVQSGPFGTERGRSFARNLSHLFGSNVLVGLIGLASLPVLTRNLGPATYGQFSLFVALLGVFANLDFSRQLLIRELSAERERATASLLGLSKVSAWMVSPLAFVAGWFLFGAVGGLALGLGFFLHARASASYALLAADGRIGLAGSVRNGFWAAALVCAAVLSFRSSSAHVFLWPFVIANLCMLRVYGSLASTPTRATICWKALAEHKRAVLDLVGFSVACALVVAADRAILERTADGSVFGRYAGEYDLAVKINLLSTSIGLALFPILSRLHTERGHDAAARAFVRLASKITLGYFAVIFALIQFHAPIVRLVLGAEFSGGFHPYVLLLVGVFLHLFGFLLTPWQRACGDYRTQRRAYVAAAIVVAIVGPIAIPMWGVAGAAATYLASRVAEVLLLFVEIERLGTGIVSRGRVAALVGMVSVLAVSAALEVWRAGA